MEFCISTVRKQNTESRQTGSESIFLPVIDWYMPISLKGVAQDAEYNGKVWNVVSSCFARQTRKTSILLPVIDWFVTISILIITMCSASRVTPFLWKRYESINNRQENIGTSCLASDTGSEDILLFTIVFYIWRNPRPVKTAQINQ